MPLRGFLTATVAAAVAAGVLLPTGTAAAAPLNRPADPVVLTGAQIPALLNGARGNLVGFRWTGSAWAQLPIQIDERAVVNFGKIYNNPSATFYNSKPALVNSLVYTSGNTWTGNDPNNKFDADDELVFMARDAGVAAPGGQPVGTKPGTGVQIKVTDPLIPGAEGYVYLYRKALGSGLKQGAGVRYLTYKWKMLRGGYKSSYLLVNGPNPEDSLLTGATYKHHFSDRWLSDALQVTAPGASGVDILDRHKALFAPNTCVRSEDTFNFTTPLGSAEGAFVTSKVGPVRVIRSYVGANSGPNTQRTHLFYDRREDIVTNLRVHAIGSIMDVMDYSPAATGMTYRNSLNQAGVTIDGSPDTVTAGAATWEQVTGPQGTVNTVAQLATTWTPASITSYYLDDTTPSDPQCTGDAFAYGTSGLYLNSPLPNTDPAIGGTDSLTGIRTMFFESPGGTATTASTRRDQVLSPLTSVAGIAP